MELRHRVVGRWAQALSLGLVVSGVLLVAPGAVAQVPVPTCGGKPATIVGTEGPDELVGTAGNDVIVGLGGQDVIRGLGGDDVICGGARSDRLYGGAGDDWIHGGSDEEGATGFHGQETYYGDLLDGGPGNDRLAPGGDTTALGRPATCRENTYSFASARVGVRVDLTRGVATGQGTDRLILVPGCRVAVVGGRHDDRVIGRKGLRMMVNAGPGSDRVTTAGALEISEVPPTVNTPGYDPRSEWAGGRSGDDHYQAGSVFGTVGSGKDVIRADRKVGGMPIRFTNTSRFDVRFRELKGRISVTEHAGGEMRLGTGAAEIMANTDGRVRAQAGPGADNLILQSGIAPAPGSHFNLGTERNYVSIVGRDGDDIGLDASTGVVSVNGTNHAMVSSRSLGAHVQPMGPERLGRVVVQGTRHGDFADVRDAELVRLRMGGGGDTVLLDSIGRAFVSAGSGHDEIRLRSVRNGRFSLGDGDDRMWMTFVEEAHVSGGRGRDRVKVDSQRWELTCTAVEHGC